MDKKEVLGMLKKNVDQFNKFRKENPAVVIDLSGADLSGANLVNADLGRANLAGANLQRANLDHATLGSAVLEKADLRGANITSTNFHRAKLQGADLSGCHFDFEGEGRMCMNINFFKDVSWDKEQIEEVLRILNQNKRWHIKYELVAKK